MLVHMNIYWGILLYTWYHWRYFSEMHLPLLYFTWKDNKWYVLLDAIGVLQIFSTCLLTFYSFKNSITKIVILLTLLFLPSKKHWVSLFLNKKKTINLYKKKMAKRFIRGFIHGLKENKRKVFYTGLASNTVKGPQFCTLTRTLCLYV